MEVNVHEAKTHLRVVQFLTASDSRGLAVEHAHTLRVADLPAHHRDPFDRLLVAQAQIEKLVLGTIDRQFERYDVAVRFAC